MAQKNQKLKPYKEVLEKNLYSVDYEDTTSDGKKFPKNRVKVDLVSFCGEVEVKGEVREYEGTKIVITNSKLQLQDGNNVIKQKSMKSPYGERIVNDETKVKLSVDEWDGIIEHFKNLSGSEEKKNIMSDKFKKKIGQEEEISIEDIPF